MKAGVTLTRDQMVRLAVNGEPESGVHPVVPVAEQNKVTRRQLEEARGKDLDALVQRVGLQRMIVSQGAMPDGFSIDTPNRVFVECDVPLRNRAIDYADEWGLLEDDELLAPSADATVRAGSAILGVALESARKGQIIPVRIQGCDWPAVAKRELAVGAFVTLDDVEVNASEEPTVAAVVSRGIKIPPFPHIEPPSGLCAVVHPPKAPPFFTVCVAGNRPALVLREDGSLEVFGDRVAGEWKDLVKQLGAIQATEWDIKTRRLADAIAVEQCVGDDMGVVLGDDGSMKRSQSGETIVHNQVANAFACQVHRAYSTRREHIIGRALFDADPEVIRFVERVADARLAHALTVELTNGVVVSVGERSGDRLRAAFDKAWQRDEMGKRTQWLARAGAIEHRLEDL